ncbi:MAG: prolyl oligopeptidase family serine peptidase [Pseudomonadota bacterium]
MNTRFSSASRRTPNHSAQNNYSSTSTPAKFRPTLIATYLGLSTLLSACAIKPPSSPSASPSANSDVKKNNLASKPEKTAGLSASPSTAPTVVEIKKNKDVPALPTPPADELTNLVKNDPYKFLEQLDLAETQNWMKTQHDSARRYLAQLLQQNSKKNKQTAASSNEDISAKISDDSSMQRVGNRLFYYHADQRSPHILYSRETIDSKNERELVDLAHINKIPNRTAIENFKVSPDGAWVALIIGVPSATGTLEQRQLIVADTKHGKVAIRPITGVESSPFLSWRPDSRALFFLQTDPATKASQVVMRLLAGDQAGKSFPVFGNGLGLDAPFNSEDKIGIVTSPASPYTLAIVQSKEGIRIFSALSPLLSGNEVSPVQTANGTTPADMRVGWYPLITLKDQVTSFDLRGDWFYAITQRQKPNGELVRLRLSEPRWEEADLLIPDHTTQQLNQLRVAQDALYVEKREDGYSQLIKLPYNARYQNTGELQAIPEKSSAPSNKSGQDKTSISPATSNKLAPLLPTPTEQGKKAPIQPNLNSNDDEADTLDSTKKPTKKFRHHSKLNIQEENFTEDNYIPQEEGDEEDAPKSKKTSKSSHTASKKHENSDENDSKPVKAKTLQQKKEEARRAKKEAHKKKSAAENDEDDKTDKTQSPGKSNKKNNKYKQTDKEQTLTSKKKNRHQQKSSKEESEEEYVAPVSVKKAYKFNYKKQETTRKALQQRSSSPRREIAETPKNEVTEQHRARIRSRVIRLALPSTTPNTQDIKLPVDGMIQQLITDPLQPGALARMNDWTRPLELVHIDSEHEPRLIAGSSHKASKAPTSRARNQTEIPVATKTSRLLVPADDSANPLMLPLTLITPENLNPANSHKPLLLILDRPGQGFASPNYRPDILAWLQKGGIVALADLFPKGYKESDWSDTNFSALEPSTVGRLENIVEYLYSEKIAEAERFAMSGDGINASIIATFLSHRPNSFASASLQAGVYDALSSTASTDQLSKNWPISSYHHIKDKTSYPSVLVLGNTNRKLVIQAAKFVARLQNADKNNQAFFYSAARPLGDDTRLLFLWNQVSPDNKRSN